ncbi:1,4-dihydroxy-2-naphthoate octaprenyltransferase [Halorhodospira halophila]|nr:1,4-dihydroxy-2-naphthoate octaprenyltransferase [Halorhodospira halophila]MBK5943528.1 1,4-dihydroxy-2-naphthoate octaprenyltransferase [Halorhodospira halophila]
MDRSMTQTSPRPSWPTIAWHAIRPRTLPLSLSPILAGSAVGWVESGVLRLDVTLVAALSTAAIQIGTNLQNDAADTLNQTDSAERIGPVRVTERGWLTPRQVMAAAYSAFALALVCGAYLVAIGGLPILVLGILSVLAGYAYSGGPFPISRGPFGELFVIFFFGLVAVGGVVYLYTGAISPPALVMGLAVGLPAAAVLLVNNLRDREGDREAGRWTLAILLGPLGSVWLFGGLLAGVALGLLGLAAFGVPWTGAALGLAVLPFGVRIWRSLMGASSGEDYNRCLARTGVFQLLLALVAGAGLVAGAYLHGIA